MKQNTALSPWQRLMNLQLTKAINFVEINNVCNLKFTELMIAPLRYRLLLQTTGWGTKSILNV